MNEYKKWALRIILFCAFIFAFSYVSFKIESYLKNKVNPTVDKTTMWVIDDVHKDSLLWVTIAHNLSNPILGVKSFDTIKPTYSAHDTINFFKQK